MCSYHEQSVLLSSIHLFTSDISSIRNTDYHFFYGGNISISQQNDDFSLNYTDLSCEMIGLEDTRLFFYY